MSGTTISTSVSAATPNRDGLTPRSLEVEDVEGDNGTSLPLEEEGERGDQRPPLEGEAADDGDPSNGLCSLVAADAKRGVCTDVTLTRERNEG